VSEKAAEKQKAQGESGDGSSGGTAFVTGCKGESGHIDERPHADKNDHGKRMIRLNQLGRRVCGAEKAKRIEESPAQAHWNDCCRGFLVEDGVADDACEKCGPKERNDGGGQAKGDKKGRGEDCEGKCDTANRPAGPATTWNGTLGAIFLIKLSILPVV